MTAAYGSAPIATLCPGTCATHHRGACAPPGPPSPPPLPGLPPFAPCSDMLPAIATANMAYWCGEGGPGGGCTCSYIVAHWRGNMPVADYCDRPINEQIGHMFIPYGSGPSGDVSAVCQATCAEFYRGPCAGPAPPSPPPSPPLPSSPPLPPHAPGVVAVLVAGERIAVDAITRAEQSLAEAVWAAIIAFWNRPGGPQVMIAMLIIPLLAIVNLSSLRSSEPSLLDRCVARCCARPPKPIKVERKPAEEEQRLVVQVSLGTFSEKMHVHEERQAPPSHSSPLSHAYHLHNTLEDVTHSCTTHGQIRGHVGATHMY